MNGMSSKLVEGEKISNSPPVGLDVGAAEFEYKTGEGVNSPSRTDGVGAADSKPRGVKVRVGAGVSNPPPVKPDNNTTRRVVF